MVCAVLFGLFLMHGAPASAAGGCHGALAPGAAQDSGAARTGHPLHDAGSAWSTMPAGHGGSAMAPVAARQDAARPEATAGGASGAGNHGVVCVSTPARHPALLGPAGASGLAALALLAARGPAGRPPRPVRTGRRGPPVSGRSVLLRVCVARV